MVCGCRKFLVHVYPESYDAEVENLLLGEVEDWTYFTNKAWVDMTCAECATPYPEGFTHFVQYDIDHNCTHGCGQCLGPEVEVNMVMREAVFNDCYSCISKKKMNHDAHLNDLSRFHVFQKVNCQYCPNYKSAIYTGIQPEEVAENVIGNDFALQHKTDVLPLFRDALYSLPEKRKR